MHHKHVQLYTTEVAGLSNTQPTARTTSKYTATVISYQLQAPAMRTSAVHTALAQHAVGAEEVQQACLHVKGIMPITGHT